MANPSGGGDLTRLQSVLDNVVGIDIHPLAVTISRATYVLALGPLVRAAKRPIHIPVYLADSLFLPTDVQHAKWIKDVGPGYRITFGDREVLVPASFVKSPDLFDEAIAAASTVAAEHATSRAETPQSLRAYLAQAAPRLLVHKERELIIDGLWHFAEELADLIRMRKNSIWAFIVRNAYRPAMLQGRFGIIVGNPPWLSYRYIQDPAYQKRVKLLAVQHYRVAPRSQRLMTQMELATAFLAHALTVFGRKGTMLGFVMPRSILSADQHANLRARTYNAPIRLTAYWDLWGVQPLFNVPACVLFAERDVSRGSMGDVLPIKEWDGQLSARDVPWSIAEAKLTAAENTSRVISLGARTAFSTTFAKKKVPTENHYTRRFRQGATIVPRSFYFVRVKELEGKPAPDILYFAETDPDQAKGAKPPYKDVRIKGNVEGRFLYSTAISKHILPFIVLPLATVVLPIERHHDRLHVVDAAHLRREGHREFAAWMSKAEAMWKYHKKKKAGKQTVYQRLDYHKELTSQDITARHLVLYNAAGTNLAAAYLDRHTLSVPFVVEHKLYWATCDSQEEADYLIAILNADAVNRAIKPFQSVGLMGERDIEKKVLDLAFPIYDGSEKTHRDLARLAAEARNRIGTLLTDPVFPSSLALRRKWVRTKLKDLLDQIDEIVQDLIWGQDTTKMVAAAEADYALENPSVRPPKGRGGKSN